MHPDSGNEELQYLSKQLHQDEQFNGTKFYWIGQANRFQLSIPQSGQSRFPFYFRHYLSCILLSFITRGGLYFSFIEKLIQYITAHLYLLGHCRTTTHRWSPVSP